MQYILSAATQQHASHALIGRFCSLAALIDGQIFCVHGGLSPTINTIDQVFPSQLHEAQVDEAVHVLTVPPASELRCLHLC